MTGDAAPANPHPQTLTAPALDTPAPGATGAERRRGPGRPFPKSQDTKRRRGLPQCPRAATTIDEHLVACAPRYLADLDVVLLEADARGDHRLVARIALVRARLAARILTPKPKGWFRRGLTGARRRRQAVTGVGRHELP